MNDFGGTLGGPLSIPHLYNGRDKTFFFISYEGLRLPRETPILLSVPSLDMRNGNLGYYLDQTYCEPDPQTQCPNGYTVYNPDGSVLASTNSTTPVPVSQISSNLLNYLMPKPNYGDPNSFVNNYQINFPAPISANQGDVRLDRTLTSKQNIFARFSYKNRQVITAPSAACTFTYCAEAGSPLQGGYNTPEIDEGLTFAHNYVFSPRLLNEFRGGYNAQHTSETQSYSTVILLNQTGLTVPQPDTEWSEAPQVLINGFMSTGAGNPGMQRGQIIQALDNLTWTHQNHTFKFGADFRRISDHDENIFGNYRSGWYVFNGDSDVGSAIADPYTAFLLGHPDYTEVTTSNNATMNGLGYTYAFFGQDDWKITPRLTLNLGLRYEVHPPMREIHSNSATFEPGWSGIGSDGSTQVNGAVVVSNARAVTSASQSFVQAISPTPVITAAQAGIPSTLRYTDHTDLGPRIGFAWRVFGTEKTVLRGGWGRFIETPLGFQVYAGDAVASSFQGTYNQAMVTDNQGNPAPLLSFSNPFASEAVSGSGSAGFYYSYPIRYKDPTVQQWNLTVEQDLGHSIGLRVSYTGSHGQNLDAMVDLNQVPANSIGYSNASPAPAATGACITDDGSLVSDHRSFPCWSVIQSVQNAAESNYNSGEIELSRHSGKGVTFDASYSFTRDLSNAGGATPNAFAVAGGSYLTDRFHPRLDYGNVIYDRRHRFLATYLYDLPFGRGQRWLSTGGLLNRIVGDWQLGGVAILQSGPFLTPFEQSTDPGGTNILSTIGQTRADLVAHTSIYPARRTSNQWLNSAAFEVPDDSRGYFGNAGVGSVVGPGTANFSFSLTKTVALGEKSKFLIGVAAANAFNHRNYEPPNMQVDSSGFGSITALQAAEGAGPRSLELSGRITF